MELKKILLVSLGHLACDINGNALPALLPYLAATYNFDYQACGALMFAYAIMSSLVQPVFGLVADRYPRKWFIPLGILLAGCGFAAVGYVESYLAIFAMLMVCGVGGAIFHPEGARYANLISGTHKGAGMSFFSVGGNSGLVFGPLLVLFAVGGLPLPSGATLGGFGLHGTAIFAVLACGMAGFIYWNLSRWDPASVSTAKQRAGTGELRNDWAAFSVLSICILARSILFLGFNTYLPLYWQHVFHQSVQVSSGVLIFFCSIGVASNIAGGFIADRWGFANAIRWGSFAGFPFIALLPFTENPYVATLLLVPIATGLYAPFSSMVILGQRYLGKNMGLASGLTLGIAMSIGGMFTPFLGWVADTWGGLPSALHLLGAESLAGALASLALKKENPWTVYTPPGAFSSFA